MSIYSAPSQPTSTSPVSSMVPLGGPSAPAQHITPVDVELAQRIKMHGLVCLDYLHGDQTWDHWHGVGEALLIITEEALVEVRAFKWDANNKQLVKEFNLLWEHYEAGAGKNHKPLSKQERSALREVMTNPAISAWRATLTGPEKRQLNYPKTVLARFKAQAKAKAIPAEDRKPSPQALLKAENIELQEELHARKQRTETGSVFSKDDSTKAIATAIIGTFDGSPNRLTKVEAIARELNAWVKKQKMVAQ